MTLAHDLRLGRTVRRQPWSELTRSTYSLILERIRASDWTEAADLLDYFHDEALVCHRLYDQWLADTRKYLAFKGLEATELETVERRVCEIIAPESGVVWDRDAGWSGYDARRAALGDDLRASRADPEVLGTELLAVKEAWRLSHDLDVDLLLGLFQEVVSRFGEPAIGEMWEEHLLGEWFDKRYARFDVSRNNWAEGRDLLTFLSFEAMHGHLCGPDREGDVEFEEFEDRLELRFDPCGTGGRSYRGEPLDGTGPRMEAPYGFEALKGAYDFTWNKAGICTYCAHCCILTEKMPAQAFGYPVRVIDPPSFPHRAGAKCRYTIYKDLRAIPAEIYERIGLEKPVPDRKLGSQHGPFKS